MGRQGLFWGTIGAGAFAGSVMVLMPPTSLKANWTPTQTAPTIGAVAAPAAEVAAATYTPVPQLYHLDSRETAEAEGDADMRYADPDMREELSVAAHDRAYGDGYAWAADRGLDDAEACETLRGDRRDGCMDYVTSL